MKKVMCLVMLILMVNIWSDFTAPILIAEGSPIQFAGEEAILVEGANVYFTFVSNGEVKVAVSQDNGFSFDYTTIGVIDPESNLPVISQNYIGDLFVFFEQDGLLQKAISTDIGETFEISPVTDLPNHIYASNQFASNVSNLQTKFISPHYNQFQYFTDTEESVNADGGTGMGIVSFWGQDVIQGLVHSNSDIWIRQNGGGDNNGWPTFYNTVTTAGELLRYPTGEGLVGSGAPIADIFREHFEQNGHQIPFNGSLDDIRTFGDFILDGSQEIAVIELQGNNYSGYLGDIQLTEIRQFPVYSWFPSDAEQVNEVIAAGGNWFEDTEIIGYNEVAIYDTIWSPVSGSNLGSTNFVEGDLYIYGEMSGMQTWGCSGDAYIIDDITYANTPVGDHPDGFIGFDPYTNEAQYDENAINQTDCFALATEKSIKIAYKFRMDYNGESIMYDNNIDGINLYGYFLAAGKGDEAIYGDLACHYDGVFTFDYQHPHGSTPNFVAPSPYSGNDTLYSYVDFHKYVWPIDPFAPDEHQGFNLQSDGLIGEGSGMPYANDTCGFPYGSSQDPSDYSASYPNLGPDYIYPDGTDVPWYNPVWPEAASYAYYYEDKKAKVFGSIIQRRRGFMRRTGGDPYNHTNPSSTNLEEFHYGGTHGPTGYSKEYYYDNRFKAIEFPHMPRISDNESQFPAFVQYPVDGFGPDTNYLQENLENYVNFVAAKTEDELYYLLQAENDNSIQSFLVQSYSDNSYEVIDQFTSLGLVASFQKLDDFYFLEKDSMNPSNNHYRLVEYQEGGVLQNIMEINGSNMPAISAKITDDQVIITSDSPNEVNIYHSFADDAFQEQYAWNSPFSADFEQIAIGYADNKLHLLLKEFGAEIDSSAPVYYIQGDWAGILPVTDAEAPELEYSLNNFPNPFNPITTISFNAKSAENVEIEIFNVKGQRIRDLKMKNEKSKINNVIWDGADAHGKPVASGVYMYRLIADDKAVMSRKMILLK